jgi:hypothetical protein
MLWISGHQPNLRLCVRESSGVVLAAERALALAEYLIFRPSVRYQFNANSAAMALALEKHDVASVSVRVATKARGPAECRHPTHGMVYLSDEILHGLRANAIGEMAHTAFAHRFA